MNQPPKNHPDDPRGDGNAVAPSVLLVLAEDRPTCTSLGALLVEKLGCRIHHAFTLASAMEMSSTVRLDLVVLATSNRDEALKRLRAFLGTDRERRVPVVVVVRGAGGGDHLDFLKAGADDALPFLCSVPELLARIERRIARQREQKGQAMSRKYSLAGDLTGASLVDLVALLEHSMMTGTLELLTRRGTAQLLFQRGQVKHASFANVRGRSAFFELLREREGQFEFVPGEWVVNDESSALEGPNAALLLEGSQAMDENPEEAPGVVVRRNDGAPGGIAPALAPDSELAEEWLRILNNPATRGEIRFLGRDQVREWTAGDAAGQRLRLAIVTDVACGVRVFSHLAAPISQEEIAGTLRRSPSALGFTWTAAAGQTLEVLLLDQERLRLIVDSVQGSPGVLILAPSYGDFLTFNVISRTILQRLLQEVPPLAILGVGNRALEGQVRTFLKLAKIGAPARFLEGSLWKLEVRPRTLIEEAVRQWAALPAQPRSRAA